MDTAEQSGKEEKGENQPDQGQTLNAAQAAAPMPVIKPPASIWMPPSTLPGHDTEIRYWGINE